MNSHDCKMSCQQFNRTEDNDIGLFSESFAKEIDLVLK